MPLFRFLDDRDPAGRYAVGRLEPAVKPSTLTE